MTGLPFAQNYDMGPEETEIRAWLKANRKTLAGRDQYEVASMAVRCGFNIADVCMVLASFEDALRGSRVENRAAFHIWRVETAIEQFTQLKKQLDQPKKFDLSPLWKRLAAHTTTGQESA